jgi:hypothetical protein
MERIDGPSGELAFAMSIVLDRERTSKVVEMRANLRS